MKKAKNLFWQFYKDEKTSLEDLATFLSLSKRTVSNRLSDPGKFTAEEIVLLAMFYKCSQEKIMRIITAPEYKHIITFNANNPDERDGNCNRF